MLGKTRKTIIRWLGGWHDEDVLREAFKELWLPLDPEHILHSKDGVLHLMGKPLRPDQIETVKLEARQLSQMKLWGILKLDVRYHLSRKMFEECRVKEDLVWGQLATFLWDIIKTRVEQLGSMK